MPTRPSSPAPALALALAAALLAAVLAGCAPSARAEEGVIAPAAITQQHLVQVNGLARSYLVRAPKAAEDDPLPLLVVFHGAGGSAEGLESVAGLTTEDAAYIVAYPNGTQAGAIEGQLAWNASGCCGLPAASSIDDVAFVSALLDDLEAEYPVDPTRIYLAGFSNGGMLSYRLACELGNRISGIAVVGGAFNVTDCSDAVATSVLIVHGTADATVPYDGGPTNERTAARFGQWQNRSIQDAVDFWQRANSCEALPLVTRLPLLEQQPLVEPVETHRPLVEPVETYPVETQPVTTKSWTDCTGNSQLRLVTIEGGTHTWPKDPDASALIRDFFGLD